MIVYASGTTTFDCIFGTDIRWEADYHIWGRPRKGDPAVGLADYMEDMELSVTGFRIELFGRLVPLDTHSWDSGMRGNFEIMVRAIVGEYEMKERLMEKWRES